MKSTFAFATDWLRFSMSAGFEWWRGRTALVPFGLVPYRYQNPYPFYLRLRERAPICRSRLCGGVVLSRAEHVDWALEDPRLTADLRHSRVWRGDSADLEANGEVALAFDDGPHHGRLRDAATDALQSMVCDDNVARWANLVEAALARLPSSGETDLIGRFVDPLARSLCADLLGVTSGHGDEFDGLMREGLIFAFHDGDRLTRFPALFRSFRGESRRLRDDVRRGFRPIFDRRGGGPPGIVAWMRRAGEEGVLTHGQGMLLCEQIMAAAYEAFSFQLGNLLSGLAQHPETYGRLLGRPALHRAAVKEFERYDASVQVMVRFVKEDLSLDGHALAAGEQIVLLLGSANRDGRYFAEPDTVRLDRSQANFAYGKGRHRCAGMHLGRLLQTLVLERFTERYRELRPAGSPKWTRRLPMRGLTRLPVSLA